MAAVGIYSRLAAQVMAQYTTALTAQTGLPQDLLRLMLEHILAIGNWRVTVTTSTLVPHR